MGAAGGGGTVTITKCTFLNNSAAGGAGGENASGGNGYGGAIFNLDGSVALSGVRRNNNTVTAGAGGRASSEDVYNLAFGNDILTGGTVIARLTQSNKLRGKPGLVSIMSLAVNGRGTNTASA